jgi:hypothetical protein
MRTNFLTVTTSGSLGSKVSKENFNLHRSSSPLFKSFEHVYQVIANQFAKMLIKLISSEVYKLFQIGRSLSSEYIQNPYVPGDPPIGGKTIGLSNM